MTARIDEKFIVRLLDTIPDRSMSAHQLCCRMRCDHRTIRKYIQLIVHIQNSHRLKMEINGLRVLVRRENGNRTNTTDGRE